jgi:diguanylate cyclase (GGDEF)-like protein
MLAQAGVRVVLAKAGADIVAEALPLKPDVVILDIVPPEFFGLDACARLRGVPDLVDVPILVLTGQDEADLLDRAFAAGATDFAAGPVAAAVLGQRLRYMLRAKRTLDALRTSEARLAQAQRIAKLGNWDFDQRTRLVRLSPEAATLLGAPAGRLVCTLDELTAGAPHEDAAKLLAEMTQATRTGKNFSCDHRVDVAGEARFLHSQGAAVTDAAGTVLGLAATTQDVTDRMEAEAKVRALAFYDTLTGLPNRLLFTDLLGTALSRASRLGRHVAVMFLDLDGFKSINDSLGHPAGDRVLEQVAIRLRQVTREYDTVARGDDARRVTVGRLGGDEFLLAITDLAAPGDAERVARRILEALHEPIRTKDGEIQVSASIGMSIAPQDGSDVDDLLKNADTALYHAKDRGRNTYEFYSPEMSEAALHRMILESRLRGAVEREEFALHYQPQMDAAGDRIIGVEALLRWHHPELGIIGPAHFVHALEQNGLIHTLGPWIVRTAARQLRHWHDAGMADLRMAINLSGKQLRQADIVDVLVNAVAAGGVAPRFIEFEITESVLIQTGSEGVHAVNALRQQGYGVAMDDFGTGYSSLAYLTRLPVSCIKIDRSFTADVMTNTTHAAVVQTIIELARRLRIDVLAEGVERMEQRDRLLDFGCTLMQGYLFGAPVPAAELTSILESRAQPVHVV